MRRYSLLRWAFGGCLSAALGWALGGLFGSFLVRTLFALVATAIAFGLLMRLPRTALLAGVFTALVGGGAYVLGAQVLTPLIAWPAAAIVLGFFARFVLLRRRVRILAPLAAPVLGIGGFLAGVIAVILIGFSLNESRVIGQFMWGGAAGFGLLLLGGLRGISGWLDRQSSEGS